MKNQTTGNRENDKKLDRIMNGFSQNQL